MHKNIYILFISFLIVLNIKANINFENIKFKNLTIENKLISNDIKGIHVDDIGSLWLGTNMGIMNFTGNKLTTYSKIKKNENILFKSTPFFCSTENENNLFFGTNYGLEIINKKTHHKTNIKINKFEKKQKESHIQSLFIDSKGSLFIGTNSCASYTTCINDTIKELKKITLPKNLDNKINYFFEDSFHNVWIGTKFGIYIFDKETDKIVLLSKILNRKNKFTSSSIDKDSENNIWFNNGLSLMKLSGKDNVLKKRGKTKIKRYIIVKRNNPENKSFISKNNYIKKIAITNNNIWIAFTKSLVIYDIEKEKKHIINYTKENGFSLNYIRTLTKDKQGLIYIGSKDNGLYIYDPYSFKIQSLDIPNYNGQKSVTCIKKDKKGNLWIGLDNSKLYCYIKKENKFIDLNFTGTVKSIDADENNIYLSNSAPQKGKGGLVIVSNLNKFYKTKDPKSLDFKLWNQTNIDGLDYDIDQANSITIDYDNTIWLSAFRSDVLHLKVENKKIKVIKKFSLTNGGLNSIGGLIKFRLLRDSSLMLISSSKDILKYNRKENIFKPFIDIIKFTNVKFSYPTKDIYLDKNNYYWICTHGSGILKINKYNFDDFEHINYTNNNAFSNSLITDKNNIKWVSTLAGIEMIDKNNNIIFSKKDGLTSNNLSENSMELLDDNNVIVGSLNGLNIFNTNDILKNFNYTNCNITIDNIILEGKEIESNIQPNYITKINLPNHHHRISFKISILSFSNYADNYCEYRLKDKTEWEMTKKEFYLDDLKTGKYTLQIRGVNASGHISNHVKEIEIKVEKPFYLKWYGLLLIFIIITSSIYTNFYFYRYYSHKKNKKLHRLVEAQTKELSVKNTDLNTAIKTQNRLYSIIAHDLINPFNNILGINKIMYDEYEELYQSKNLKKFIKSNMDSSESLFQLLQNLLFWTRSLNKKIKINRTEFNIYNLCAEIKEVLDSMAQTKNNNIVLDINKELFVYADKQMINTIIRNIVTNAIKFTENGTITIKTSKDEKEYTIIITDTGIGMPQEKADKIFTSDTSTKGTSGEQGTGLGLNVSKDFVSLHKGNITMKSDLNKGTSVIIKIPNIKSA